MKKEKEKTNFAPFLLIYDHIAAKYEILTWSCDFVTCEQAFFLKKKIPKIIWLSLLKVRLRILMT